MRNDPAPRVAAVICNYQHGTFLGEAVRSVQSQTHPVDEIIVVDDASGPDEEVHLRRLEPPVRVLRSAANRGAAAAGQLGTDSSSCELLAYLDADDLWVPTKIERQLQHLRANPDAVATHTGTVVFDGVGNEREYVNVKPLELVLHEHGRRQVGRLLATLDRHAPLLEREFGRGALAELRRQKILDHRHTYPRVQQPAAMLGGWLAGLGLAPPHWKWLVATE